MKGTACNEYVCILREASSIIMKYARLGNYFLACFLHPRIQRSRALNIQLLASSIAPWIENKADRSFHSPPTIHSYLHHQQRWKTPNLTVGAAAPCNIKAVNRLSFRRSTAPRPTLRATLLETPLAMSHSPTLNPAPKLPRLLV